MKLLFAVLASLGLLVTTAIGAFLAWLKVLAWKEQRQ